jgi:hypothetical protein
MPLTQIRNVGIHAFIAGVSDYTYLPGDDDPPPPGGKLGMKKLKMAALSAFRFMQWLRGADAAGGLAAPLASYDVMLAPSPVELPIDDLANFSDDLKTDTFTDRMWDWRERVASGPQNIAIFYFAGHGIQRGREDSVLMLQDFAQPRRPLLSRAVSFGEVFQGMCPSGDQTWGRVNCILLTPAKTARKLSRILIAW